MRIFSKFRDYYDSALAYGQDPNCVYIRKRRIVELNSYPKFPNFWLANDMDVETHIMGFCGELIPFVSVQGKYFYNMDSLIPVLEKLRPEGFEKMPGWRKRHWDRGVRKRDLAEITDLFATKNESDIFQEQKTPLFHVCYAHNSWAEVNRGKIEIDPCLERYSFFKVKDSFTAFQEIDMFISGVLGIGAPKTVNIQDKDMIFKKGFDNWSFRKHPDQKRLDNQNPV